MDGRVKPGHDEQVGDASPSSSARAAGSVVVPREARPQSNTSATVAGSSTLSV